MAKVQIIQRDAHLASGVRIEYVEVRDTRTAKATLTAISNTRWGSGESRGEEAISVQWVLWGAQAENAATYLSQGSHVNVVGRLRNNNFERGGEMQYRLEFTVEEIDYLDSRVDAEARRAANRSQSAKA